MSQCMSMCLPQCVPPQEHSFKEVVITCLLSSAAATLFMALLMLLAWTIGLKDVPDQKLRKNLEYEDGTYDEYEDCPLLRYLKSITTVLIVFVICRIVNHCTC